MPVVVITGMRHTGKTTFLQRQLEFEKRGYVTFDDFPQQEAAILGYNGMEPVKLGEKTWALPLSLLLS
jgi:predicted AAA+ superfamily ATPase